MSDNEDCDLIDNAFVVACVFHNMILSHDGLDTRWEDSVNWRTLNPDEDYEDNEDDPTESAFVGLTRHTPDELWQPLLVEALSVVDSEADHFYKMRNLLANHLHYSYMRGELSWPRPRKEIPDAYNSFP